MTPARFIAFIGGAAPDATALIDRAVRDAAAFGLAPVFLTDRLVVLANPEAKATALAGAAGVVVGTLFRHGAEAERDDSRGATITVGQGASDLCRFYWGSYVAFVVDTVRRDVEVLRDPSGSFGCYRSCKGGVDIVYSDVEIVHALGLIRGEPDPDAIAHHLTYLSLRAERTALRDVIEVLPGTPARFDGRGEVSSRSQWSPWSFCAKHRQIIDRSSAIALVGETTRHCVSAWSHLYPSIIHELSGGLDSSIVAACLARQPSALNCVTFATSDVGSNEQAYAQQVADRIDAPLRAVGLNLAESSLRGLAETLSPRPGSGMLHQLLDRALTREAEQTGASVFFSGGGGDNVFCYLHTAAPAADALRRHGVGAVFWRSIADLAALHACTTWRAGGLAVRKAVRPLQPWPSETDFLALGVAPASPDPHPWLNAPAGALHGQREHIFSLMASQSPLASQARHGSAAVCYPLLLQPLIEACLRIPSWMWISDGRNRAIARDAFAGQLPPAILLRRTKGDFTGLLGALYEMHRQEIGEVLLDGWLADQGLIDRRAIETYLTSPAPVTDYRYCRLMDLANAEMWARSWLNRPPPRRLV